MKNVFGWSITITPENKIGFAISIRENIASRKIRRLRLNVAHILKFMRLIGQDKFMICLPRMFGRH